MKLVYGFIIFLLSSLFNFCKSCSPHKDFDFRSTYLFELQELNKSANHYYLHVLDAEKYLFCHKFESSIEEYKIAF